MPPSTGARVGVVLPYMKAGGTERQAAYLLRALTDHGYDPRVLVAEKTGTFAGLFEPYEIVDLQTPFAGWGKVELVRAIGRTIKDQDLKIVVSRAWNTNAGTAFAARMAGVPSVVFLSGSVAARSRFSAKRVIHKSMLHSAHRIVAVSNGAKRAAMDVYGLQDHQIDVVHNGVDRVSVEEAARGGDGDAERRPGYQNVLFVGRLNHRKGLDVLLRAFEMFRRRMPEAKVELRVVGSGEEEEKLRLISRNMGLDTHVRFVGERQNPFPFMANADVFVLPSRSEGFPNVLLEAMALGTAVVAADCRSGPAEVLTSTEVGTLVPNEDPAAMAEAMGALLADRERRVAMGTAAKRLVETRFSTDVQTSTLVEIIRQAVQDSG